MLIFTKKHINVSKEGQTSESVWHLLMNVKNNYLFTKPLKWANKKYKKFENKNDIFKKKYGKTSGDIILHLCTKNLDHMIYSS